MARAKIFEHRGSQAVLLPKELHFDVEEVTVRKEGDKIILEPPHEPKRRAPEEIAALWARIDAIRGDEVLVLPDQPKLEDPNFDW